MRERGSERVREEREGESGEREGKGRERERGRERESVCVRVRPVSYLYSCQVPDGLSFQTRPAFT